MKKLILSLTTLTIFSSALSFAEYSSLPTQEQSQKLVVHNRILAKVNDKTISVLDVMKKMDIYLNRYYPDLADSPAARHQYYTSQWKEVLSQMIDNELMMADAEKLELKVSDAEVRETVIDRFGPNIMSTLDKIGLTYEEARSMIHSELIVQKMTWYRIHSKALQNVNPQDIKIAYQEYVKKNPPQEKWQYQVLSIRTKEEKIGEELSKKAHARLDELHCPLADVVENIKGEVGDNPDVTITVSEEYNVDEKSLADSHKTALTQMVINSISAPVRQLSRFDQSVVYRIFHLKNHTKVNPPSFAQVADKLKDELLQKAVSKESETYITKIREKFGYDSKSMHENIPTDFQPFSLR